MAEKDAPFCRITPFSINSITMYIVVVIVMFIDHNPKPLIIIMKIIINAMKITVIMFLRTIIIFARKMPPFNIKT